MITSSTQPVDPALFQAHAGSLDALRELLGEVRDTVRTIERERAGVGALCGSILESLGDLYAGHRENVEFAVENLRLMARGLDDVADGDQELKGLIRHDVSVTTPDGTPVIEMPEHSLHGCMDTVIGTMHDPEWDEPQLFAAPVSEFATRVDELTATLRGRRLHCALTYVAPLRRLLDELTGTPQVVAEHAAAWHTISTDLHHLSALPPGERRTRPTPPRPTGHPLLPGNHGRERRRDDRVRRAGQGPGRHRQGRRRPHPADPATSSAASSPTCSPTYSSGQSTPPPSPPDRSWHTGSAPSSPPPGGYTPTSPP